MSAKSALLAWIRRRDAPVVVQFFKYGFCGCVATAVYLGVVWLLVLSFPDRVSDQLEDGVRSLNLNMFQAIAFVPSNVVAYLLNRAFVFTPGRHPTHREFTLFIVVAVVSSGLGLLATDILIRVFGAPNWSGTAASVVTSVLVNFVSRKFLVFAR